MEAWEVAAYQRLACAVVVQAAQDDDREWFETEQARELLTGAGFDVGAFMEQFERKQLVRTSGTRREWVVREEQAA